MIKLFLNEYKILDENIIVKKKFINSNSGIVFFIHFYIKFNIT